MASRVNEMVRHLRNVLLRRDGAGLSDEQLLTYFIEQGDDAAVAALVRRHGPMVWSVCRRILDDHHDAEDAFQATFLVLVRRAASIASRSLLANWLYGVAQQTALKARATRAKRRTRERQVSTLPEPAVEPSNLGHDLQAVVDQELGRLPDKYRTAIVLCDLQGQTRAEAAAHLGVPLGTLAARLSRGRALLAKRLARHSLAVSAAMTAALLAQQATACPPATLMTSTIKAITSMAMGQAVNTGAVSASVAALTKGVLKLMLLSKLRTAMVFVLALTVSALGGVGSVWIVQRALAFKPPEANASQTKKTANDATPADKVAHASKLDLTPNNFTKLAAVIGPQGNEWRHLRIHWYTDIVAARKKAAQEDKPILVFRTGGAGYNDPLGQC